MLVVEGDFWRDGAVCVRQAFEPEWVELAAEAIEANLAALSPQREASERRRGRGVRRGLLLVAADRTDVAVHP